MGLVMVFARDPALKSDTTPGLSPAPQSPFRTNIWCFP